MLWIRRWRILWYSLNSGNEEASKKERKEAYTAAIEKIEETEFKKHP